MKKSNTKLNYIYSAAYNTLNMLLPLLTAPYIARVIGPEGLGIYNYNYSIAYYFMVVAMLGINNYGNRSVAKARDDRSQLNTVFSEIYTMQLMMSAAMIGAYALYTAFFAKENLLLVCILLLLVLTPLVSVSWFFMGLEQFKLTVTRGILVKFIVVASMFLFVRTRADLWKYTMILALSNVLGEAALMFFLPRYVSFKIVPLRDVFKHFKPNLVLFVPVIAVTLYTSMDRIMLKALASYEQVGFYANAERIITLCLAFVTALGNVLLPRMTNMLANDKNDDFLYLVRKSMKFVSMMTVAMCAGIFAVAKEFVPVFFGAGYEPCIPILQVLAFNLLFMGWGNVMKIQYLIPKEHDMIYIKATLCGLAANLVVNLLLIWRFAAVGAAFGTIAAEVLSLAYILTQVKHEVNFRACVIDMLPYAGIGLFMVAVLHFMGLLPFHRIVLLVLKVFVGAGSFGALSALYWYCSGDDFLAYFEGTMKKLLHR